MSIARVIRERRTIHNFDDTRVPPESLLREAIEHATWAPNHHLTEPWRFYLLGPETAEQICLLNAELVREKKGERAAEIKLRRWRDIPGWLLMTTRRSEDTLRDSEDFASGCCAAQNLALYLWEQGVGLKWTTGAVTRSDRFFDLLAIDRSAEQVVGLFWYGYPADIPAGVRQPLDAALLKLP